jgi:mono/diheme cytochrome c family protein
MKLKLISGIYLVIMVLVYACENDSSIEFKRYYSSGAVVYHDHCQNCHGNNGEGLAALIPPLNDSVFLKSNQNALACIIQNGWKAPVKVSGRVYDGAMPAESNLTPIEIAQVITYVGNTFGNKIGLVTGDDVVGDLAKCN